MLNCSAEPHEPRDSTRVLEVLPGKLGIKRHSLGTLYVYLVYVKLKIIRSIKYKQMNIIVFQRLAPYHNKKYGIIFNNNFPHKYNFVVTSITKKCFLLK